MAKKRKTSRKSSRKKKNKPSVLSVIIAILLTLILLVLLISFRKISTEHPRIPGGGGRPPGEVIPGPPSRVPGCPLVQFIAIPGTWESTSNDDPYNPLFRKDAMLLNVTKKLSNKYNPDDVDVYTQPYVAQISNPVSLPPDGQASYNTSRHQGESRALAKMHDMNEKCPGIKFVLAGFSQGAVIAGDIANLVGNLSDSVRPEQILGVFLLADGRRDRDQVINMGPNPSGRGVEVNFSGFPLPGIKLLGSRENGVGRLKDKTFSICAPGDIICDCAISTKDLEHSALRLIKLLTGGNPIHSAYNTKQYWQYEGLSGVDWIASKSIDLIDSEIS